MKPSNNIMKLLYEHSKELHKKAQILPFFKELFKGNLKIDSYVGQLRAFGLIHGTLEKELKYLNDESIKEILNGYMPKYPLLLNDLNQFKNLELKYNYKSISKSIELCNQIQIRSKNSPKSLLGYLYVLEGSTNGLSALKIHVQKNFQLEDNDGLDFLTNYGDRSKINWEMFSEKMNSIFLEDESIQSILDASQELFEGLIEIYNSLCPIHEIDLINQDAFLNKENLKIMSLILN